MSSACSRNAWASRVSSRSFGVRLRLFSFVFGDIGEAGGTVSTLFSFDSNHLFLKGVGGGAEHQLLPTGSPAGRFRMFQLMFAIITPALIVGAIAERMKFSAVLVFVALWMFVGLFPDGAHGVGHRRPA